ncbi:MAG: homoserine kinase [Deltaproteobacteria bacterium]
MYKVIVPATSANLGPGFDCLGVALDLYNSIEVEEIGSGLKIESISGNSYYNNENNLIYKSMKHIFDKVGYNPKGIRIIQKDNIPGTRGLGSSAACIVAGLLAGNIMTGEKFSKEEIAFMAGALDGHPDNTTPAVFGGLRASILREEKLHHVEIQMPDNLKFAAFIPDFTLSTAKARMILPRLVSHEDMVFNLGRLALLVSSLSQGKLENLALGLEDKMHQPYRKRFIPDVDKIFSKSMELGARGCYISGAGPTLMALVDSEYNKFCDQMGKYILDSLKTSWTIALLNINKNGAEVYTS